MSNPILTKNYVAEAAVSAYRIVKFGTADGQVVQGAAATDSLIGIVGDLGAAITERVDVHIAGIADVEYGGTVTRGGPITSDANGKAVAAAPAAGSNNRIVGFAAVSAAAGDIGPAQLAPGSIQG